MRLSQKEIWKRGKWALETVSHHLKGVLNPNFRPFSFELNKI